MLSALFSYYAVVADDFQDDFQFASVGDITCFCAVNRIAVAYLAGGMGLCPPSRMPLAQI